MSKLWFTYDFIKISITTLKFVVSVFFKIQNSKRVFKNLFAEKYEQIIKIFEA